MGKIFLHKTNIPLVNYFQEKSSIFLLPQGINAPNFADQFPISLYEMNNEGLVFKSDDIDKIRLIYAPSLLGTWLLYKSNWRDSEKTKLLIDKDAIINKYSKVFITLYLSYEKFRLGSDVPSSFLTRILQREGYYPHLKSVTIGEWLTCIRAAKIYDERVVII